MESLGYIFCALFLVAGYGFSVVSFVWGCCKHSRRAKWLGGIIALICTLVTVEAALEVVFDANLEMNPWINNDAEVVGMWVDHSITLTLATNHTFNYISPARTVSGTWTRDDYNLYLNGSNFAAAMRFVQFRDRYRLMAHPLERPPNMWNDLGFTRK